MLWVCFKVLWPDRMAKSIIQQNCMTWKGSTSFCLSIQEKHFLKHSTASELETCFSSWPSCSLLLLSFSLECLVMVYLKLSWSADSSFDCKAKCFAFFPEQAGLKCSSWPLLNKLEVYTSPDLTTYHLQTSSTFAFKLCLSWCCQWTQSLFLVLAYLRSVAC